MSDFGLASSFKIKETSCVSDHLYILAVIAFTVYGQLTLKWRMSGVGLLPSGLTEKLKFLLVLLLDPIILSGFLAAFLASLAWIVAMTKFELSYAYPFMGLNYVMVVLLSSWLFDEPLQPQRILGVVLILLGTFVLARG